MEDGSGWRSPLIKDDFGRGGTGSGGLLRLIRSLKLCCPRPASWSTNLQRQECVMDLFVPALASNPCADKAHCAGKAGRLAKRGNASRAQIWGQPGGKPPLGAHDCVGSALKPSRILRPCRLVLHAQRGFRGDEQVHDTLQTLSDNRASPDRQKVVHAYREIAAGAPRSPHRFSSSPYRGFGHVLSEPWQGRLCRLAFLPRNGAATPLRQAPRSGMSLRRFRGRRENFATGGRSPVVAKFYSHPALLTTTQVVGNKTGLSV